MPKTIVVTGTATGIGRATVNKFDSEGRNVVATVRKESDLKTHSDLGNVKTLLLDVDDEAAAAPFAVAVGRLYGADHGRLLRPRHRQQARGPGWPGGHQRGGAAAPGALVGRLPRPAARKPARCRHRRGRR